MAKLLLVEDDGELAAKLKVWFTDEGYLFESVNTGEDALQMLSNFQFDVVLLDRSLPGISGTEVCKRFRATGGRTPIIFLTGRGEITDKLEGLDIGADDYLVKPFDVRELSSRIRSVMRRTAGLLHDELRCGNLVLHAPSHTMFVDKVPYRLMPTESALLEHFLRHPNRFFGSKDILDAVWPSDKSASSQTVRSWMRNLRQKLESAGKSDLIRTVQGSGYLLDNQE
ncbi:MAG: response regulator transcription factor [Candidatus Obscuribacterales bacterium]